MADNFELYRQAVFLIGEGRVDWGADFAVITAYNPDGASPVGFSAARLLGGTAAREEAERLNQAAHLRLKADMPSACEVTGCSPDLVHREPGWAANIPLEEALRLGRLYRQDAIFWVSAGQLYLVACTPGATLAPLGPSSDRLRSIC